MTPQHVASCGGWHVNTCLHHLQDRQRDVQKQSGGRWRHLSGYRLLADFDVVQLCLCLLRDTWKWSLSCVRSYWARATQAQWTRMHRWSKGSCPWVTKCTQILHLAVAHTACAPRYQVCINICFSAQAKKGYKNYNKVTFLKLQSTEIIFKWPRACSHEFLWQCALCYSLYLSVALMLLMIGVYRRTLLGHAALCWNVTQAVTLCAFKSLAPLPVRAETSKQGWPPLPRSSCQTSLSHS